MTAFRRATHQLAQAHRERIASLVAQDYTLRGRFFTQGVGEFLFDVKFPVVFYERPDLFPGAPALEGDTVQFEHLPTSEMSIAGWVTQGGLGDDTGVYYTGAQLGVRVAGRSEQRVWIPYMFVGKAMSSLNVE